MSTGVVSNMPPPARSSGQKRQREQTLLEEDEWTDRIEAIIQRDFFPDLPKLQNKLQVGAEPQHRLNAAIAVEEVHQLA